MKAKEPSRNVPFSATESLVNKIDQEAEAIGLNNRSAFIRVAVMEKIEREEQRRERLKELEY